MKKQFHLQQHPKENTSGINWAKEVNLYSESHKALFKEKKKNLSKWKDTPCSWIRKRNVVKIVMLPKLIDRINKNPYQNPQCFSCISCQANPKTWYRSTRHPARASPVVCWLRIHLSMEATQVQSLVQEDPTGHGATKLLATATELALQTPRAAAAEPTRHGLWSPCTRSSCSTTREATAVRSRRIARKSSPRSPQLGKVRLQPQRPRAVKN